MEKMQIVRPDGIEYGEMSHEEIGEATSLNEMAFQVYVDYRFNRVSGENTHEASMKAMRDWDAMMRGEISIEEYEKG